MIFLKTKMKRKTDGTFYVPIRSKYQRKARPAKLNYTRKGGLTGAALMLKPSLEKKTSDIDTATYNVSTTGVFTLLHSPVLGSDFTNRIGRKTNASSIYIRGRVVMETAATGTTGNEVSQQARCIIFIDNQPNGATPTVTDLLKEALPSSQLNLNNRDRFKIIKDKNFVFDPTVNNGTIYSFNHTVSNFKCFIKVNVETVFNATNGGTIADINSGAIYMFWIGSGTAGTNTDVNAILSTRVRFLDA